MPSVSKAQQRFMGQVHALQKGELKPSEVSAEVRKAAKTMKKKDAKDFASTKHKGLPDKVEEADKIHGGLADKETPESLAKKHGVSIQHIERQLSMGEKVEMEHTDNKSLAHEIAMDHLDEDPNYYTKLKKMENESIKELVLRSYIRKEIKEILKGR